MRNTEKVEQSTTFIEDPGTDQYATAKKHIADHPAIEMNRRLIIFRYIL